VGESGILDISKPGKKLAWATVTAADGSSYTTNETSVSVENGTSITTHYIDFSAASEAEIRLVSPEGVRFVSHLSIADYEFLKSSDEVEELRFGTLILPQAWVAPLFSVNKESLKEILHLDVPVADGQWYEENTEEGVYSFAGSVVNVKRENWNRKFIGVGYIDIVMKDGTVHTVYAEENIDQLPCNSICAASTAAIGSGTLTEQQTAVLQKYTDADEGKWMEIWKKDLNGLNILAMGDSLFSGTSVTNPPCVGTDQWINLLGKECSWNLTNLGVAGMTVSFTDKNPGHKESIYDSLYNRRDTLQYYWGTGSSKYFNIGNISGNPEDVEMILLEGGNNDFGTDIAAAQGAWGEKDPATFMGAWQLVVDRLLVEYPNAKIVFVTPWEFGEKPRTYYTRQIITMYENYSKDETYGDRFYLIDAGKKEISGVDMTDTAWRAKYAYDGFHLNKKGMEMMAYRMLPLIWEIAMDGAQ
ncbi:MAG: SGNH/GDSL hydrolase family protein, partial [Clostridia bacterium]|nr:SGNH/GDSL hydrolase family protein [Clostridia bacterium]